MKDWAIATQSDNVQRVVYTKEPFEGSVFIEGIDAPPKQLKSKCGEMFEEYEEEITNAVRRLQPAELNAEVCGKIVGCCGGGGARADL